MSHGLTVRDINTLYSIFGRYDEVTAVHLFGSRARGTSKFGSDIDLVVMNANVSKRTMLALRSDLEDSELPYFVDLLLFSDITNEALKAQISIEGVAFYEN